MMPWVPWALAALGVVVMPAPRTRVALRSARKPATSMISVRARRSAVTGAGLAALTVLIWPTAYVVAGLAGVVAAGVMWWAPAPRSRQRPAENRTELTMICELWAGCLEAGLAMPTALSAVLQVTQGSTRQFADGHSVGRLAQVCGLLALGVEPEKAWESADLDTDLRPVAMAARRSATGGAGLAMAVKEHARLLRRATAAAAQSRAGRAGVMMAAPLALCFLPAFICLGLAPVVIALLRTLGIVG